MYRGLYDFVFEILKFEVCRVYSALNVSNVTILITVLITRTFDSEALLELARAGAADLKANGINDNNNTACQLNSLANYDQN